MRAWLMGAPKPEQLRITCNGEVSTMAIGNTPWIALGKTLSAKDPELVEALDEKGVLLRALKPGEEEDAPEAASAKAAPSTDPETRRFELFARLLADAYKHSNEVAFGKMVELFVVSNKRAENLEKSLASTERILRKQFEDALEQAPQEGSLIEQMAASFMAGKGNMPPPTNGAAKPPNGKA
jgi:hypothetical protein